jgi:hypothetical protein
MLNFDAYIYVYKVSGGMIFPAKRSTTITGKGSDVERRRGKQERYAPGLLFVGQNPEIYQAGALALSGTSTLLKGTKDEAC